MLTPIKVESFSEAQLISFCSEICSDYDQEIRFDTIDEVKGHYKYRCSKKDKEGEYKLPPLERVTNYISKHHPGDHYFDGDEYVPCLLGHEEKNLEFKEYDCQLLGQCKFYQSIKRVVYVDPCIYAEDHDVPATPHPKTKRLSFEEYEALLKEHEDRLLTTRSFLSSLQ
jgi:hypothetical protein